MSSLIPNSARLLSDPATLTEVLTKRHFSGLVVDTFPTGWRGEIAGFLSSLKTSLRSTVLVARYKRNGYTAEELEPFTHILAPYSRQTDEWECAPERTRYLGLIVKQQRIELTSSKDSRLVIFDTGKRINARFLHILQKASRDTGMTIKLYSELPARCSAQKFLMIGAGYNTFYETSGQPVDIRYLPLARKWDDQHRRARRYGLAITNPAELVTWLQTAHSSTGIEQIESESRQPSTLSETLREMFEE